MLFGEGEFSVAEKISEIILYLLAGSVIIFVLILTLIFIVAAIIQNIVRAFGVHKDSESDKSSEKSSPKIIYFLSAAVLTVPAVLIIIFLLI